MEEKVRLKPKGIDLENYSIYKNIWIIAWPACLSQVFSSTLNITDMIWIGRLGSVKIAGVALCSTIIWIMFVISNTIAVGSLAMVARFYGAEERDKARGVALNSFLYAVVMAFILGVLGYILSSKIIYFFNASPEVSQVAIDYLQIIALGFPAYYFLIVAVSILSGAGDTKTPLKFMALANIINIFLDAFLINGWWIFPRLEVKGAALASVISMLIASILAVIYFNMKDSVIHPFKDRWWNNLSFKYLWRLLRIGVPAFFQDLMRPITGLLMFRIVAFFGTSAIAAFGVGMRGLSFSFIFMFGLVRATSTLVGQYLGAEKPDKAEEAANKTLLITASIFVFLFVLYFFGGELIIKIFNREPEVVRMGTDYLRMVAIGWILGIFSGIYGGAFRGAGDTRPPMIAAIIANWVVKLPVAFIISGFALSVLSWEFIEIFKPYTLGVFGIWLAITVSMLIEGGIDFLWFRRGRWKKKKV